ncbi:MAG: ATP-binding protein [Ferruginibacter sp.]
MIIKHVMMLPKRCIIYTLMICTAYVLCPSPLMAQYTKLDSAAVFSFIEKAEEFFTDSKYDSALFYCQKAENLSKIKGFKKGLAYALIETGDIYIEKDDLGKAAVSAEVVNNMGIQMKDSLIAAIGWMQMAQVKLYSDKFDEAIPLFEKSLRHYLAKHPSKYAALTYNDLGYTWGRKGELSKDADNLLQSISIYEKYFPDKYGELAIALSNLSTVYYTLNQKEKAIEFAKRSLFYKEKTGDLARLSLACCNLSQLYTGLDNIEADKYLKLCVTYAQESNQEPRMIHAYVTAAHLYNTEDKPEAALEYELKAISLLEIRRKDSVMLARRYLAAGVVSRRLKKDSNEAMTYYNKSLNILQLLPDKVNLRDFYLELSNYYKENKNYDEAYVNYKKYILYKDSIINENTQASINEIATRYETEKKDNEIVKLNINEKIRLLEIEKQRAIIAGNLLEAKQKESEIAFLSQQRELQNIRIKQQSEELEKQLLISKNDQQQLALLEQGRKLKEKELQVQKQMRNIMIGSVMVILLFSGFVFNRYKMKKKLERQKELLELRNNIARDLHDEIGSTLTSIKILSEVSRNNLEKNKEKSAVLLSQITDQSEQMQQGMSDIVWAIKADNDRMENMLVRMREYTTYALEPRNIAVSFAIDEKLLTESSNMQQRRDLFLIFKEAVNNAAKYSEASNVKIMLTGKNNDITLTVEDDGKGFEKVAVSSSNGLKNMRARAEALGGFAEIISEINKGTTVSIRIPAT